MPDITHIQDKYYKSITEIPLKNYVDCLIDKDLTQLIISGNPDPDNLAIAWHEMGAEYADAIGNEGYDLYLTLAKELGLLQIKYSLVENCVKILQCVYESKYADEVNAILRTSFAFDWNDQDAYQKELIRCLNRNKSNEIQIALKKSALEAQEQQFAGKGKAPTREYFLSVLITLSDHSKYEIRDNITVYSFCDRIFRLNEYCKQAEKLNNGK